VRDGPFIQERPMTRRVAGMCVVALGLLLIAAMATAQGRGQQTGPGYLKLFDSSMPFDAHDLAGIWSPNGNAFGGGGRCRPCRVHRPSGSHLSALSVGIWSPHNLDRRAQASKIRGHRSPEMVGICDKPLGREHAGRRFDWLRRTNMDRLFRVSA